MTETQAADLIGVLKSIHLTLIGISTVLGFMAGVLVIK